MRKIVIIMYFIMLASVFTGCRVESYIKDEEIDEVPGVSMSEVTLEERMATFSLVNEGDETIWFGIGLRLERKRFGKWYRVDQKYDIAEEMHWLSPGKMKSYEVSLDGWKNTGSGRYRFIRDFRLTEYNEISKSENPGKEIFYTVTEFDVQK